MPSLARDLDRARGALLGLAAGDAFGASQADTRPKGRPAFPALCDGPQTEMEGGGPFGLSPGEVGAATQTAVCLADSLVARGKYDAADAAKRYAARAAVAFAVDDHTRAAMQAVRRGVAPKDAGTGVWLAAGRDAPGNGALSRAVPLAVYFACKPADLRRTALEDAALTHADPRCRLAGAAIAAALAHAFTNPVATGSGMAAAAADEVTLAASLCTDAPAATVAAAVTALREDLAAAALDDPGVLAAGLHMHRHTAHVRIAVRLAFWELIHAKTLESAVLDATNRGGDAAMHAALAGALHGALRGESAVPTVWRTKVLDAAKPGPRPKPSDAWLATRLFKLADVPGSF